MSDIQIETITKREQHLHLDTGILVALRVEQNEVGVYANGEEVGRLKFRSLTSANSPESIPLYSLVNVSMRQTELLHGQAQEIAAAAIALFKEYAGAGIRLPKDYQQRFNLSSNV